VIAEHATEFASLPIQDWTPESGVTDPTGSAWRVSVSDLPWEEVERGPAAWVERFDRFLRDPAVGNLRALVVGFWGGYGEETSQEIVQALIAARNRLSSLTAIFLGDIVSEENEISWINQCDVSPLLAAYPRLQHFRVRGSNALSFGVFEHATLRELAVESGGLSREIVRQIFSSDLPALEHLELWLGDAGYGADVTVEDLAPLFTGQLFPRLLHLGLRDSEIADEVAAVLAHSPLMERLKALDLSLGTLGDAGAGALLGSPHLSNLERLDVHHHFCSPEVVQQLERSIAQVDASDPQEPHEWNGEPSRFVAVSE
jgi:hypothetical protein